MTFDDEMQTALLEATRDVVGRPDLARSIREGRRRRRQRAASVGIAALAVVGLTAGTAYQLGQGPADRSGHHATGVAHAPAYHDFVPGTDIDETLQAAVADDLPTLGRADSVTAWRYVGAHEVEGWRRATVWALRYPGDGQRLFVEVHTPDETAEARCDSAGHSPDEGQPDCTRVDLPSGGYVVSDSFEGVRHLDQPYFVFHSSYVGPDGSMVEVTQEVSSVDTWRGAVEAVRYAPDDLRPVLTDPRLQLPAS